MFITKSSEVADVFNKENALYVWGDLFPIGGCACFLIGRL
ncbi:hypothetical protein C1O63_0092 [Dehalococcoides mccartyi]|nr:hypothetical protein C1O63_0092 [Dehalococcoides mccartyi]